MNDPHVERLFYTFRSENEDDRFDQAEPLSTTIGDWDVVIVGGELTATPNNHFPDDISAKVSFGSILNSWETAAFLSPNRYRISFQYRHAEIVDRKPTPGIVELSPASLHATGLAIVSNQIRHIKVFPEPNCNFNASTLTDELIRKIKRYLDGKDRLSAMAYLCLTTLEDEYGQRKTASKILNMDEKILNTLGRLCDSSDPEHGRKARGKGPSKYSPNEKKWIEDLLFIIVNRIGEINAGVTENRKIIMADLPPLDDVYELPT